MSKHLAFYEGEKQATIKFYYTKFFVNSVDIWQMNYWLPRGSKISLKKDAVISQCLFLKNKQQSCQRENVS